MRDYRKGFIEFGLDKDGFEIEHDKNTGNLPDGITGEILWNLWDIGVKFGQEMNPGIGFKASPLIMELYDYRDNECGGTTGLTIGKTRGTGLMSEGVFLFELKNGTVVIWDRGITVEEISDVIEGVDNYALSEGLIRDGERIEMVRISTPGLGKMAVEHVFSEKGTVMPIMSGNSEEALDMFDHPELLTVIDSDHGQYICLKSEKEEVISNQERAIKFLEERGISLDQVGNMSIEEILELKKQMN